MKQILKKIGSVAAPLVLLCVTVLGSAAWAQSVDVQDAWARASVAGQRSGGAFMVLKSSQPLRLVSVVSPVAGISELHEMAMDGNIMRMRAISALDLPAGKAVELKPGGYHVMLMELKQPLKAGTTFPMTLRFEDTNKKIIEQKLMVSVRAMGPQNMSPVAPENMPGHGQMPGQGQMPSGHRMPGVRTP